MKKGEHVYKLGDAVQHFYIIINGRAQIQVRNEEIHNYDWAQKVYKSLLDWKKIEFDPKVQKEMQLQLVGLKLKTDVLQISKFHSSLPQRESIDKRNVDVHIKMMDNVRNLYNRKKVVINRQQTDIKKQDKVNEMEQIMKYFSRKLKPESCAPIESTARFDCERFIKLTNQEKLNLYLLKAFKNFMWKTNGEVLEKGHSFGTKAIIRGDKVESSSKLTHTEAVKCISPDLYLVALPKEVFSRVSKRIYQEEIKGRSEFLKKLPLFS